MRESLHAALIDWARQAGDLLDWAEPWETILEWDLPYAKWFQGGKLNRHMIARDIDQVISVAGVKVDDQPSARFLAIPASGIGPDHPESGEKLSLVVAVYRAKDFADAKAISARVLAHQGAGHSIGIHTADDARAMELGRDMPTCRVIVNQAHCFATGGSFDNGLAEFEAQGIETQAGGGGGRRQLREQSAGCGTRGTGAENNYVPGFGRFSGVWFFHHSITERTSPIKRSDSSLRGRISTISAIAIPLSSSN